MPYSTRHVVVSKEVGRGPHLAWLITFDAPSREIAAVLGRARFRTFNFRTMRFDINFDRAGEPFTLMARSADSWLLETQNCEKPCPPYPIIFSDRAVAMINGLGWNVGGIEQRARLALKSAFPEDYGFCTFQVPIEEVPSSAGSTSWTRWRSTWTTSGASTWVRAECRRRAEKPPQDRRGFSNIRCLRLNSLVDHEHNTTLGRVNDDDIVIHYDVAEALDLWNLSNDVARECLQLHIARYLRAKRQAHAHVDFAVFRHAGIDEAHLP
jgi:hypothetical protein